MKTIDTSQFRIAGDHGPIEKLLEATPCPDETELDLYLQGALREERRLTLDAHIEACEICSEVMVALAELITPEENKSGERPNQAFIKYIDRYQIVRLLGKGGMGAVYEGFDPNLQRSVALKVIRRDAWGDDAEDMLKQRMLREARALAGLAHPHILPVYESGEWEGELYIAMQLVDGEDLRLWLVRQQPTWSDIVSVFQQAAKGLHAAHMAGIIHRDIKPDNFLLSQDQHVYLADFGLVSHNPSHMEHKGPITIQGSVVQPERLTMSGTVVGTHGYLAPELYRGQPADARSDQFAFCVALYEALYEQMPHTSLPLADHLKDIESGECKAPMTDDVPPGFLSLLHRGMHPIPSKRFPSMEVLRDELTRLLEQEETSPTQPEYPAYAATSESFYIPPKRSSSKPLLLLVLIGLLVCILGAGSVLFLARSLQRTESPTKTQTPNKTNPKAIPAARKSSAPTPGNAPMPRPALAPRLSPTPSRPRPSEQNPSPPPRKANKSKKTPKRLPVRKKYQKKRTFRKKRRFIAKARPRRRKPKQRRYTQKKRKKRAARGSIYWWMARMPYKRARICHDVESRYKRLSARGPSAFRRTQSRTMWRRYSHCLMRASECHLAMRSMIRYHIATTPGSRVQLTRIYKSLADKCPPNRFLGRISGEITRYMKSVPSRRSNIPMWCRRLVSRLFRKQRRFSSYISRSPYRRHWQTLLWEGMRCSYQRAVSGGRHARRSTCRRLRRNLQQLQRSIRTSNLRRSFERDFPLCR